jgi:hypothetical protein
MAKGSIGMVLAPEYSDKKKETELQPPDTFFLIYKGFLSTSAKRE